MACVLVVGSGYQLFRQYLLQGVAERFDVVLLDPGPITWQGPFLRHGVQVDLADRDGLRSVAGDLVARYGATGILTWDEKLVGPTADLAAATGLVSMPVAAARACRDKARQRAAFYHAGVPSARHRLAASPADAVAAARELGYPVVVKPRSRAASVAVQVVGRDEELLPAFDSVRQADVEGGQAPASASGGPAVLVEEFLRGTEVSVDSWVLDGEVVPLVVAHKRVGFAPYFVEVGHVVGAPLDPATGPDVLAVVAAANRALGVDRCVTHTEVMLTGSGPRVVEVNGRVGGDLIPYLGQLTTPGLSVGALAATVATGERPGPVRTPELLAGIRFVYPRHDMAFDRLSVRPGLSDLDWVREVRPTSDPGTQLRLPPRAFLDRAGYCVVTGTDLATVDERLGRAERDVVAVGTPLATDTG